MSPREPNPRLERTNFELRSTGLQPEEANPLRFGIHTRGYLPHVKREGARYFVTFRLADSLPKEVFLKIQGERAEAVSRFHAQRDVAGKLGTRPLPADTLEDIELEYRRKVDTSREANKILGRTGETFWQPESFDHWIRNEEEHARCCRYVRFNPVKAGLCTAPEDWKWSSAWRAAAKK